MEGGMLSGTQVRGMLLPPHIPADTLGPYLRAAVVDSTGDAEG